MDFMRLLRSLEEFLYEVMTWLLFYPRTMWRVLRRPLTMLGYSDREQKDAPDEQYTDTLSPPLFLMITILLSHAVEIASHQRLPKPTSEFAQEIAASEQNLLILRSILFAIYPLMFARARLKRLKLPLNRDTLRGPFYAQCYIAAPAAFMMGIAAIFARAHAIQFQIAGIVIFLITVAWYLTIETRWFRKRTQITTFAAARMAFGTWFLASFINAILSAIFLGT
ncbi:hypothetical protein ACFB49_43020 [Sphingomonas sp. DBB INV C78]|uniref:hypothetical protein n=1 Tax=Sphingomonas sp. DBB INV C78 TaxID=3349434 RepID=UPI0036D3F87C